MKRLLCPLICLTLLLSPALAQEMDEADMAQAVQSAATPDPAATPQPPEQVYAVSDVTDGEVLTPLPQETPDFVRQLLKVAVGELGYTEGDNNYSKYGTWAGDPYAAWCAEFVCWCVNRTDQLYGTGLLNEIYPNYTGQNTGRDWFVQRGRFVYRKGNCPGWGYQWLRGADHLMTKNEYVPHPGDLVFFSYNDAGDTEHVALVESCATDARGSVIVNVIEGNNPSSVQRNRYSLNDSQILGFGACEDVADTTMRVGNRGDKVLTLQERLHQLGLLEERHLTGGYGGNTKAAVIAFQREAMQWPSPTGIADRETQQAIEAAIDRQIFDDPDNWLVSE